MKSLLLFFGVSLSLVQAAQADLRCASKKDQVLYYTTGQILLTAEAAGPSLLTDILMNTTGSDKLGADTPEVSGKVSGGYVRFEIGGDAWCSYKLALPADFSTRETSVGFLDAYCEENSKYEIRLSCSLN